MSRWEITLSYRLKSLSVNLTVKRHHLFREVCESKEIHFQLTSSSVFLPSSYFLSLYFTYNLPGELNSLVTSPTRKTNTCTNWSIDPSRFTFPFVFFSLSCYFFISYHIYILSICDPSDGLESLTLSTNNLCLLWVIYLSVLCLIFR